MTIKIIPKRLREYRVYLCKHAQKQFENELDKQDIASLFGISLSHYTKVVNQKPTWKKK